jgi:hypothetical protein
MGINLFQAVTLAVAIELFSIGKAIQKIDRSYSASWIAGVFCINYGLLLFYNLAIYPVFVDPLRNVPGPRVHLPLDENLVLSTDSHSTEMFWRSRYGTTML